MSPQPPDTVTASEIADYVFCGEAYRLARLGTPVTAETQVARTLGTAHHSEKAAVETSAGRSIDAGRVLLILGLLAALVAWLWR